MTELLNMHGRPMNRRERRIAEANERKSKAAAAALPPCRPDKRPEYYDIPMGSTALCYFCVKNGVNAEHRHGRVVQSNPANPPEEHLKGDTFTICVHHLPDNAVIYNPVNNYCRNKAGDHTWEEGPREDITKALRDAP